MKACFAFNAEDVGTDEVAGQCIGNTACTGCVSKATSCISYKNNGDYQKYFKTKSVLCTNILLYSRVAY